jgi:uncharacterized protein (DUF1330 family)
MSFVAVARSRLSRAKRRRATVVGIGFDRVEKARECYDSPTYTAIRSFRRSATKSRLFLVEGVDPQ